MAIDLQKRIQAAQAAIFSMAILSAALATIILATPSSNLGRFKIAQNAFERVEKQLARFPDDTQGDQLSLYSDSTESINNSMTAPVMTGAGSIERRFKINLKNSLLGALVKEGFWFDESFRLSVSGAIYGTVSLPNDWSMKTWQSEIAGIQSREMNSFDYQLFAKEIRKQYLMAKGRGLIRQISVVFPDTWYRLSVAEREDVSRVGTSSSEVHVDVLFDGSSAKIADTPYWGVLRNPYGGMPSRIYWPGAVIGVPARLSSEDTWLTKMVKPADLKELDRAVRWLPQEMQYGTLTQVLRELPVLLLDAEEEEIDIFGQKIRRDYMYFVAALLSLISASAAYLQTIRLRSVPAVDIAENSNGLLCFGVSSKWVAPAALLGIVLVPIATSFLYIRAVLASWPDALLSQLFVGTPLIVAFLLTACLEITAAFFLLDLQRLARLQAVPSLLSDAPKESSGEDTDDPEAS